MSITTGQLLSLPFSALCPFPVQMFACPPVEKLTQDGKNKVYDTQPGFFTEDLFPPLSVQFPVREWAPLFDAEIDHPEDGRRYVERALLAPVGNGLKTIEIGTEQIQSLIPLSGCVLGWIDEANKVNLSSITSNAIVALGSDYWKTNIWKYERRFLVTENSYWLPEAVYQQDGTIELDRNDYLWELAQLSTEQAAALTRYYTSKPLLEANALTTAQLDVVGISEVKYKASDMLGVYSSNFGWDETVTDEAARWCLFYDQPYSPTTDQINSISTEQYRVFSQQSLLPTMATMARDWALLIDTENQQDAVANKWDATYRGAMYGQLNTSLNCLYGCSADGSGITLRSVPTKIPFKNWASFGDFHSLAYAQITKTENQYNPSWKRLCKIHRTLHYLQIPWAKFAEGTDAIGQVKAGRVIQTEIGSAWESATLEETYNMIPVFIQQGMGGGDYEFIKDGVRYIAQSFPQIIGFTRKQAEEQFPPYIFAGFNGAGFGVGGSYLYWPKSLEEENPKYELSFIYNEYKVYGIENGVEFERIEQNGEFFPWDPRDDNPDSCEVQNSYVYFSLRLTEGGEYVVENLNALGPPLVTYTYNNGDFETWLPNNWPESNLECYQKYAEGVAMFFTNLYQTIAECGSYKIKDKSGNVVAQCGLYGVEQVGKLEITWQPHSVDIT